MLYHRAMLSIRFALLCLCVLLVACGGGDDSGEGDENGDVQEDTALAEQPVVFGSEPVAFEVAPDGRLFFNLRQRGEIRWFDMAIEIDTSETALWKQRYRASATERDCSQRIRLHLRRNVLAIAAFIGNANNMA